MKICGLKSCDSGVKNISLYEKSEIEIPLSPALSNGIVDWNSGESNESTDTYNILLREKEINGLLVYENINSLIEFILNEYKPTGQYLIDFYLKESANYDIDIRKNYIVNILLGRKADDYRWRLDEDFTCTSPDISYFKFAFSRRELLRDNNIIGVDLPEKKALLRKGHQSPYVFIEKPFKLNGKDMIKHYFIIPYSRMHLLFIYDGKRCLMYDNRTIYEKKSLIGYLGRETYEEFDKKGRSIGLKKCWALFAPVGFKPRFLIKVPANEEFIDEMAGENSVPKKFNKPMFLFDARGTVKLDQSIEIIDEPKVACQILARSPKWKYIPGDFPSVGIVRKYLLEEEYYIACGGF
ncbi:MAG: hypothetical protein BWY26_01318 [Elusimicrobia bacterium ADurb.Bin231]|nr:MAG: hypothetical protein BWY26_01318 [Elusimicrobia bacterium ADurb.Bin231]